MISVHALSYASCMLKGACGRRITSKLLKKSVSGSSEMPPGRASIVTKGFISLKVAALASATLQQISGTQIFGWSCIKDVEFCQDLPSRRAKSSSCAVSLSNAVVTKAFISPAAAALTPATLQNAQMVSLRFLVACTRCMVHVSMWCKGAAQAYMMHSLR